MGVKKKCLRRLWGNREVTGRGDIEKRQDSEKNKELLKAEKDEKCFEGGVEGS